LGTKLRKKIRRIRRRRYREKGTVDTQKCPGMETGCTIKFMAYKRRARGYLAQHNSKHKGLVAK
jgi:hypothetical protein